MILTPSNLWFQGRLGTTGQQPCCPTLCDPTDGSLPGSPIPGILQARTLEWVAISFFNAWKWKVKVKSLSHVRLFATPWTAAYQAPPSMGFSRQEYWSGVPLPSPAALLTSLQYTGRALLTCPCSFSSTITFYMAFPPQISFSYFYSCFLPSELWLNSLYLFSCMYSHLSSSGKIEAWCISAPFVTF